MILQEPIFKNPPTTDAANVPENIDNWINKGKQSSLDNFTRPCSDKWAYKGRRFVTAEDHTQTVTTKGAFKGISFALHYTRSYHCPDSFCPLYFAPRYPDQVIYEVLGHTGEFTSKTQLMRIIREILKNKPKTL